MKNIGYLFLSFLLGGCVNPENDNKQTASTTDSTSIAFQDTVVTDPIGWVYDANGDSLVREGDTTDLSILVRIEGLNHRFEKKVWLDWVRENGDTVFVKIDSAQYLTQQMGSAGAYGYMAVVTYTLTEGSDKKFVNFEFEEGDHAMPGVYGRSNFERK